MNSYVGIDVAKGHVDLYDTVNQQHVRFENAPAEIRRLVSWVRRLQISVCPNLQPVRP